LFVAAVGLPLGLPIVLMFLVPGGIVSSGTACGLGVPLAMLAMLIANLFILPRWPLQRRAVLSLGSVGFAYLCLLIIVIAQWVDFTSGSTSAGTMVQGMKSSGRSSSSPVGWELSRLPGADFTLNLPTSQAQASQPERTDFGRRVKYSVTDPVTRLVYSVSWIDDVNQPAGLLTSNDLGKAERTNVNVNGRLADDDDPGFLGSHPAYGFKVDFFGNSTLVERVLLFHQHAYYLSVAGPPDKLRGDAAQRFFDSFKLDRD
jgi:hypothetical protein